MVSGHNSLPLHSSTQPEDIHGNSPDKVRYFSFTPTALQLPATSNSPASAQIQKNWESTATSRAERMRELGEKVGNGFKKLLAGICIAVGSVLSIVGIAMCHIVGVALAIFTIPFGA